MVLDRSGSMASVQDSTIEGVNSFVAEQQRAPGEARFTLAIFDDQYDVVFNAADIKGIKPITSQTYVPRGWTALYGAIGRTIEEAGRRFSAMPESDKPEKVVVVITTDGHENRSHLYEWSKQYTKDKVRELIEHQTGVYKWHFVYIGANQDAITAAGQIGIIADNALQYSANAVGTQALYASAGQNVNALRSGRRAKMGWTDEQRKAQAKAQK